MRFLTCFILGNICAAVSNATPFLDESALGPANFDAPNEEINNDGIDFGTPDESNTLTIADSAATWLPDNPKSDQNDYLTSADIPENQNAYMALDDAGSSNIAGQTNNPNCQPTSRKRDGTDNSILAGNPAWCNSHDRVMSPEDTPSDGRAFGWIAPIMSGTAIRYLDRQNKAKCRKPLSPYCCHFPIDARGSARWCNKFGPLSTCRDTYIHCCQHIMPRLPGSPMYDGQGCVSLLGPIG